MDEYEVREEETSELSFRAIGRFLKKSAVRMLVYVLALCVLATLVVVPLKVFWKSDPVATTRIEFVYEGVNSGLDPAGNAFDKDSIRSATVVAAAVSASGLDLNDVDAVRNAIIITDVYSQEYYNLLAQANGGNADAQRQLANYTQIPTKYDVSIGNLKSLGLKKQQAVTLVENIVKEYRKWFTSRYTQINIYSDAIFNSELSASTDYLGYYDLYTDQVATVAAYLTELSEKDSSFRSTGGQSFADVLQMYRAIDNSYTAFKSYILSNGVSKDINVTKKNIETKLSQIESDAKRLTATISALTEQIANFKPNTTQTTENGQTTIVQIYAKEYYELQDRLTAAILESASVEKSKIEYAARQASFTSVVNSSDETTQKAADDLLAGLRNGSKSFVQTANSVITDYYQSQLLSNAVRVTQSAVYVRSSYDIPVLYIYLATVVVGIVVAMIVTQVKSKKAEKGKAAAETVEESKSEETK